MPTSIKQVKTLTLNQFALTTSLGIGTTPDSALTVSSQTTKIAPPSGTSIHYIGLDANPLRVTLDTHNTSTSGTAFLGRRSYGTASSPSAVQSGATIITFNGLGYGATGYAAASTGLISIKANQNFTDTAMGTYISMFTTPDNSVTAAEAIRIAGSGQVLIGTTTANSTSLGLLRIGQSTSLVDIGDNGSGLGGIWINQTTNSSTNYSLKASSTTTTINGGGGTLNIGTVNITRCTVGTSTFVFTAGAATSSNPVPYTFTTPGSTTQSGETIGFDWDLATSNIQHASNTGITLNRDHYFRGRTHRFQTATGTITTGSTIYVDPPAIGTNAAITNAMAAILNGNIAIVNAGVAPTMGGGVGAIFIANAGTNPSTNPTGGGILYCDAGALKYRGSSGTVTTLGNA